jgi:hypothetical protein
MALDACVYCDCYERGSIRTPPPQPEYVYIDETGSLTLDYEKPGADLSAFRAWQATACDHQPLGMLVSHRLGNIARIGFLRYHLVDHADRFPVLLGKVLYNATHAGDFLTQADVERAAAELDYLKEIHLPGVEEESIIREFETQMRELVDASRRVHKPIAF